MFVAKPFVFTVFTFFAVVASVSAIVVPRKQAPKGWAYGYLEDYQTYHTRYLAIGCNNRHGDPFFDECCHPLLATETLEKNRPTWCTPSASASASASAAEPTSTIKTPEDDQDEDDDEDCDEYYDEDEEDSADDKRPSTSTKAAAAAAADPTTSLSEEETTEEPTTTKTKSTAAQQPTSDASPDGGSQTNSGGFATFFYQNGVAGACGKVHQDSDLIAAIDGHRYGNLNQKSSLCGKQVKITNPKSKKSVTVTLVDACPTCENRNSIDLSVGAFKKIATLDEGMVDIIWNFV